jgi:hypothetical protein
MTRTCVCAVFSSVRSKSVTVACSAETARIKRSTSLWTSSCESAEVPTATARSLRTESSSTARRRRLFSSSREGDPSVLPSTDRDNRLNKLFSAMGYLSNRRGRWRSARHDMRRWFRSSSRCPAMITQGEFDIHASACASRGGRKHPSRRRARLCMIGVDSGPFETCITTADGGPL